MYGINRVGADGELLTLIGSQNTDSGGNSMAPAAMMDPAARPTKVDRASDVTGLVDTGELGTLFTNSDDAIAVLESMTRLAASQDRPARRRSSRPQATMRRCSELVKCGYVKSAYLADRFRTRRRSTRTWTRHRRRPPASSRRPSTTRDGEFRKTAAVMKMVINGYAGAGTITMGGFDYHGQGRNTGETRNFRAGRCIGACLEYARAHGQAADDLRVQRRLAVGERHGRTTRSTAAARSTGPSDNQSTAASFLLVYSPGGRRPQFRSDTRKQIGSISAGGSVVTTLAARRQRGQPAGRDRDPQLHGAARRGGQLRSPAFFPRHGLGGTAAARRAHDARAGRATARSATRSDASSARPKSRGSVGAAMSRVADAPLPF